MKKLLSVFILCCVAFIYSCDNSGNRNDSMDRAEEINKERDIPRKDADFVTTAAANSMFEVEAGRLASQQATHPDVKNFAQRMVNDHSTANDELRQMAGRLNIAIPDSLPSDKHDRLNKLRDKQGNDFDREYMDMMVSDHKDSIDNFEDAAEDAENADLKNWAQSKLPTLREHRQMAEQLHETVKNADDNRSNTRAQSER